MLEAILEKKIWGFMVSVGTKNQKRFAPRLFPSGTTRSRQFLRLNHGLVQPTPVSPLLVLYFHLSRSKDKTMCQERWYGECRLRQTTHG